LVFTFSPNDYIENEAITLKVEVDKDDDCKKITSDDIKWKADKCLTEKTIKKTQTNKKTKKKREVEKKQKVESFFHFFKTRSIDDEESEEAEMDDLDEGMGVYHDAQSVGDSLSVIKYMVTKYHAASFFGATIPDYEFDEGFGDEDGDDDEDDGDDDEEEHKPKKDKKKKGPDGKQAEECKKQ
jgi:hypothetical protein